MDQEEGLPAAVQKSPYHPAVIPGTSEIEACVRLAGRKRKLHGGRSPVLPTRLVRQHRLDGSPFAVGKFIAHDSKLPSLGAVVPPASICLSHVAPSLRSAFGAERT